MFRHSDDVTQALILELVLSNTFGFRMIKSKY